MKEENYITIIKTLEEENKTLKANLKNTDDSEILSKYSHLFEDEKPNTNVADITTTTTNEAPSANLITISKEELEALIQENVSKELNKKKDLKYTLKEKLEEKGVQKKNDLF